MRRVLVPPSAIAVLSSGGGQFSCTQDYNCEQLTPWEVEAPPPTAALAVSDHSATAKPLRRPPSPLHHPQSRQASAAPTQIPNAASTLLSCVTLQSTTLAM